MASERINEFIASSAWGEKLFPEHLQNVQREASELKASAGQIICHRGQRSEYWYGVAEGLVKVSNVTSDGRPTTLIGIPAGGWFGEGSVIKHEKRPYDVVALRDSLLVQISAETFHWLLNTSLPFNHYLIAQLNSRLAQFVIRVEHFRSYAPERHVAHCLAELFNPVLYPGTTPTLQISQEEIAFLAGVSRGIVNRALRHLEEAKLVHVSYGAVSILDLAALRAFATD
jgi:CRP/FNR family transcriptional regulator, cyclic AMP receptor protein